MGLSDLVTLSISSAALIVSVAFALRQQTLQTRANNIPAVVDILEDFRSPRFIEDYLFVCQDLPARDPAGGILGLEPAERARVYNVCFFFQGLGQLMLLQTVDERAFLASFRTRILPVWEIVRPFIESERMLNPAGGGLAFGVFEVLAERAERIGDASTENLLREWRTRRM